MASSSTGQYLVAAASTNLDYVFTSSDFGSTWTQQAAAGARYWSGVASDSTGQYIVATAHNMGRIYTSSNYGVSWTVRAFSAQWSWVVSSSSGQYLAAVYSNDGSNGYGGYVCTSSNYGASWTSQVGTGIIYPWSLGSDSSGKYLVTGSIGSDYGGGYVYTSPVIPTSTPSMSPSEVKYQKILHRYLSLFVNYNSTNLLFKASTAPTSMPTVLTG